MNKTKILLCFFTTTVLYSCSGNSLTSGGGIGSVTSAKSEPFFKGADSYLNFTLEDIEKSVDFATKEIEKSPNDHKGYAQRAQYVYMQSQMTLGNASYVPSLGAVSLFSEKDLSKFTELFKQASEDLKKAQSIKPESLEVYKALALSKKLIDNEAQILADKILTIDSNDLVGLFIKYANEPLSKDIENKYEKKLKELYPNFIPFKLLSSSRSPSVIGANTYKESDIIPLIAKIGLKSSYLSSILLYKTVDTPIKNIYKDTIVDVLKISPRNVSFRQQLSTIAAASGDFAKSLSLTKETCDDLKDEFSCTSVKSINEYSDKIKALKTPEEKKKTCLEDLTGTKELFVLYSTECSPHISEFIDKKTKELTAALPSPSSNPNGTGTYIPNSNGTILYGDEEIF